MGILDYLIDEIRAAKETSKPFNYASRNPLQPNMAYVSPAPKRTAAATPAPEKTPERNPSPIEEKITPTPKLGSVENNPLNLELTPNQMVRGIILSEIIGKPVSKRNGFGRPR